MFYLSKDYFLSVYVPEIYTALPDSKASLEIQLSATVVKVVGKTNYKYS